MSHASLRTGLVVPLGLLLLLGCGGGGGGGAAPVSPAPTPSATGLVYSQTATSGWRWVAQPATNGSSHLILDLLGPEGLQIRGVGFSLQVDSTQVAWGTAGGSEPYAREGSVLTLGTGSRLFRSLVKGGELQVGIYQKGGQAVTLGASPVVSVALDLRSTATGDVPFHEGSLAGRVLLADGSTQPVAINLGQLTSK